MRVLLLLLLALLAGCATSATELDPISWQCQQQIDANRNQPRLRDADNRPSPPLPIAPISENCQREMTRKGVSH
ncbi:MAG: hypothetical protein GAK31_03251 [Stenotrophomonas maltophilia]|uniref:Lipoprotein n=1 Tax=Stenotrophomonas maltophilia TaxID=40324 RepID=A0A7V8FF39_STEMA|nr:MAG: hypothetical protein GAK31_03251 [Stenotrophomonas maltophilia]